MKLNRSSKKKFRLYTNKANSNRKKNYNIHMKCMYIGIAFFIFGFKSPKLFIFTILFELIGLAFMLKNWKRINIEYEQNKKASKK